MSVLLRGFPRATGGKLQTTIMPAESLFFNWSSSLDFRLVLISVLLCLLHFIAALFAAVEVVVYSQEMLNFRRKPPIHARTSDLQEPSYE